MRFPRAAAAAAAAVLSLLAAAAPSRADVTVASELGFDGGWVSGSVTPVRLEVSSSEKSPVTLVLRVLPSRSGVVGSGGLVAETTVFLAPGARKRLTIPVLAGGTVFDGQWRLSIETDRRVLLRHGTQYREGRSLVDDLGGGGAAATGNGVSLESSFLTVGVLGAPAGGLLWMQEVPENAPATVAVKRDWQGMRLLMPRGNESVALPAFAAIGLATAPDPWFCYEGFDALLWIDPDPDLLKDGAQLDAILEYAAHGGRLLVALTPGSRIPAGSPLARALPATATGHGDVGADAVVAGLAPPRDHSPRGTTPPVPVALARLEAVRGRVLRRLADGRPLVVAGDHGLGSVVVLAFDPRALSPSGIGDRASLLIAIFGPAAGPAPEDEGYEGTSLAAVIGHLRKRFMTPPPLGLLILGLAIYVLAIGPVDYFLLKRKGRLRRTVVTFPAIVVLFTLLAWGSSFLLFGGSAGKARVAFIDFATSPDRDADVYRGLDLLGTYSPTGDTLEASWNAPRSFVGFPWLGSGSSWGNEGDAGSLEGIVRLGPDGRPGALVDVPLRSHRTVQARFSGEVPTALDAALRERDGRRVLEITNGLRVPVHELHVVWSGRMAVLGELAPGDRVAVPLDPEDAPWRNLRASRSLPGPRGGGGFFGGEDSFVPGDGTPAAVEGARTSMARAAMGATFTTALVGGNRTGSRTARVLARQGLDLSRQEMEGRPVLVGWCDEDPLGVLPASGEMDSTVVVVRRVAATVPEENR